MEAIERRKLKFRAIAVDHPIRINILNLLPMDIMEVSEELGITPEDLEDHINILIRAGIIYSKTDWTDDDINAAYLMGVINSGGLEGAEKEVKRLKKLKFAPVDAFQAVRKRPNKLYVVTK